MTETVLLTGVTGFIAKRIALDLLNAGYAVRGSLRSIKRADEVRDAIRPHIKDPVSLDHLSFVELDLTHDGGWDEAMIGISAVLHTASPFPMTQPKSDEDLIRPAVDGALRALRAARNAGVTRIILTSSMAAVMNKELAQGATVNEADWTDVNHPTATAYDKSKTLAEKAAWDFVADHPEMRLTTVNPGLVAGIPLDVKYGTSLGLIERFFSGSDPAVPDFGLPLVDVIDVSAMHLEALKRPETAGKRYCASAGFIAAPEIARILKEAYPNRKIATRVAPKWLLRILSLMDPSVRSVLPTLGRLLEVDASRATTEMEIDFIPVRDSILASASYIASVKQA